MPIYYPEAALFEKALDSIVSQTRQPEQCILVFDGYRDLNLERIIRDKLPTAQIYNLDENSGQGTARNYGMEKSNTTYVAFLDQDDLWLNSHLADLANLFEVCKDFPFAHTSIGEIDEIGNISFESINRLAKQIAGINPIKKSLLECIESDMMIFPSSAIVKRNCAIEVGGFGHNLRGYEDDQLFVKLFSKFGPGKFINKTSAYWRKHSKNTSGSSSMDFSRLIYLNWLQINYGYSPLYLRAINNRFLRNAIGIIRISKSRSDLAKSRKNYLLTLKEVRKKGNKYSKRYLLASVIFFRWEIVVVERVLKFRKSPQKNR